MGDDIGYSDIGCYGSEIKTPNLDRLARGGLRFKHFYNMAKCETTRSSLITGQYQGDHRAVSFVSLLKSAGYASAISGKEHFSKWVPQDCYFDETFDHSLTFWATTEYFVPPADSFQRPFYLEGQKIPHREIKADILPKYKTDFITDYGLDWLNEMILSEKPFFLFLPYHVAHYPLQARPEDIQKYRGKYKKGWDAIRAERFSRMKEVGLVDHSVKLSPPGDNTNRFRGAPPGWEEIRSKWSKYFPWDSLTEEEKDKKDLEMAVFAAMIDRMDQNIGRILDRVEDAGIMDNTLILFFTDNGSCPFDSNVDFDIPPGPAESYRCLSTPWANLGNTPYRLYKQNGHEGGSKTHFIAHWPKIIQPNQITDQIGHVVDLFPTFLDIAGVEYPSQFNGKDLLPLAGNSLFPIFKGEKKPANDYYLSGFTEKFRAYRKGDWKIVRENRAPWELYKINTDQTELLNQAEIQPDQLEKIVSEYEDLKTQTKAVLGVELK